LLGYSWDRVHEEADRMDHVISEEFGDKLSVLLNEPRFDPHGDPIPTRDLKIPQRHLISLQELPIGQSRVIRRVGRDEPEFLRYLAKLGLVPGTPVKLLQREPFNGPVTLEIENANDSVERLIGHEIAGDLFVDREQE
jgi:DtxR family Mn-dependent transcriptional regulator